MTRGAPVIILTYAHSGAERLRSLLARHQDLACTAGTGILPLCEQAVATWRAADGNARGDLSTLAATSTRTMATTIITSLLARTGKRRWCETATTMPATAEAFLQLFPGTRILCLHRAYPDVIRATLDASPWGLAGAAFAPFTTAYPASTIAALTAYWAARTSALLAFEQSHPQACRRVRYEDLAAGPQPGLFDFLGLDDPIQDTPGWDRADEPLASSRADGPGMPIPVGEIPPPLLAHASELAKALGHEPMRPGQLAGFPVSVETSA
jgi:hypothetical protein